MTWWEAGAHQARESLQLPETRLGRIRYGTDPGGQEPCIRETLCWGVPHVHSKMQRGKGTWTGRFPGGGQGGSLGALCMDREVP